MRQIIFFFFLQTTVLVIWFNLPSPIPTIGKINFNYMLFDFFKKGYYQFLNVGFLLALFVEGRKRLLTMLSFVRSRMDWLALLVTLFYVSLIIIFLLPSNLVFLYKGPIIVVALLLAFFPKFFPKGTFLNPKGYKESEMSFQLKAKLGKMLPINHPETGIFIIGAAGSGKTKSVVEPVLFKMIEKGYAGVLYDYAFSTETKKSDFSLSHLAYNSIVEKKSKTKFFSINFQDLTTSSRFNPIAPAFIKNKEKLNTCVDTLFSNLSPQMARENGFWYLNSVALLKSIIIFLANQHPAFCTLPHAILLSLQDSASLMAALEQDDEAALCASPVLDAYKFSDKQFAGVIANFKVLLEKLIDEKVFWVLSGNDVPLIVNDANNPSIVALGNTSEDKNTISPILAVVIFSLINQMYDFNRGKSFVMIDELPTIILPQLSEIPATARKYKISTVVALQNMPQLEKSYSDVGAREIQASFSNHFIGRAGDQRSAEEASRMMGKREVEAVSTTKSEQRESKTIQKREESLFTPQQIMSFQTGEFIGKVVNKEEGFFHIKLSPLEGYIDPNTFKPLPVAHNEVDVEENFRRIKQDVAKIIEPFKVKIA